MKYNSLQLIQSVFRVVRLVTLTPWDARESQGLFFCFFSAIVNWALKLENSHGVKRCRVSTRKKMIVREGGNPAGRKKKEVINKDKFMLALCFVLLLLLVPSQSTLICSECSASVSDVLNISVDFERILESSLPSNYNFTLQELRPGICEATVAFINGSFYIHKESRSRAELKERSEVSTLYLRHKEFFESLNYQLMQTEEYFGARIPSFIFNLETQDNPTCKYPRTERDSGLLKPVKGILHHSFCSPKLCDGTFLLPMSYNQNIKAIESTKKLDQKASKIRWEARLKKLFWRGSNKGKKSEYIYFDWQHAEMPRQRAVRLLQNRKDSDVNFGFVPWLKFARHRYILSLAGNTYSSLFKHALRSGSCILRQDERMYEWFEPFVQKWKHYIPVSWELNDLVEKLEWVKAHDRESRNIAVKARELGTYLFTPRVLSCYTYCGIDHFRKFAHVDFSLLKKDFIRIRKVCNSKPSKRKDCYHLM